MLGQHSQLTERWQLYSKANAVLNQDAPAMHGIAVEDGS